jgi:glutamine---fructose-6-phosphate transaminase (isomerizing)
VHNGIIENHEELRRKLLAKGYKFESDTDTEVIAHLVHSNLSTRGGLLDAVWRSVRELAGAYAVAVIATADPARLVVARAGAPLLLGLGERENFVASDVAALLQVTRRMVYLDEGDCAEVTPGGVRILDREGNPAQRTAAISRVAAQDIGLGGFRHYMQKEIFEQPKALENTLRALTGRRAVSPALFGSGAAQALAEADGALLLACGTSYHAGLVARHWIESIAGIPCSVEIASEYRYRESVPAPRTLVVAISQSGETADTLAALDHARSLGHLRSLAVCNVAESALMRAAQLRFQTHAGPEIGVASTKAFTTQLAGLLLLAITLAKLRGRLSSQAEAEMLNALECLPAALADSLRVEPEIKGWAERLARREHALFLGRGVHYPIAMEGALKLKEISYIHAEAYAAGELKHGPLALVEHGMPVIAIAPKDALLEKLKSNLQEVRARGGDLYVLAGRRTRLPEDDGMQVIRLEEPAAVLSPFLHTIPLQLLAYHCAAIRGNDIDKPRNLAKSVTVE